MGTKLCTQRGFHRIHSNLGTITPITNRVLQWGNLREDWTPNRETPKGRRMHFGNSSRQNARICVQVPMESMLVTEVVISSHKQQILYEGEGFLCKTCGRLGHTSVDCPNMNNSPSKNPPPERDTTAALADAQCQLKENG